MYGTDGEITTAGGKRIAGRYVLAESGSATPSHDPLHGFIKSEGFPVDEYGNTVNDRDYERDTDAQTLTRDIASRYDSRALQNPVIVSGTGIVLSGNGRTMSGMIAAENNSDAAYLDYLRKYAGQYGLTGGDVGIFAHPRLLFEVSDDYPYTTETFAMFNAQDMKSQSRTEQAVKLGKMVSDELFHRITVSINTFATIGDFYANAKAAADAINELCEAGIISRMQSGEMYDGDAISQHARELLENVLVGKAFGRNPDAVRQITSFRCVRRNVTAALAEIADNMTMGEYSLEGEIADAVSLTCMARRSGFKDGDAVSVFARQMTMFDDESSTVADYRDAAVLMLSDLLNHTQAGRLRKVLTLYNDSARLSAGGQIDMFTGSVKGKDDILREVDVILHDGSESDIKDAVKEAERVRRTEARIENENITVRRMEQKYEGDTAVIVRCLKSFGIELDEISSIAGPNVTMYKSRPRMGVRISKIRGLKDEIAVALGVSGVRIVAPMPDGSVGIEVPNRQRDTISVSELLDTDEYRNSGMALPLALGRTADNGLLMADLADMPHLLVAGATGQGKSVGLNVMLMSLIGKLPPEELKIVLIDPKQVELSAYSDLERSYLAAPVITDDNEAQRALDGLCDIMDERYRLLGRSGKRNIAEYNNTEGVERMPYIVTVIDEYGDLVMVNRNIEYGICRLAQKARAVGIHLIIATQRPSVDIVTGSIKANFPARISFRTTTGTDSRVVLGQTGAEKLMGRGDMLLFTAADVVRAQCAYVSADEISAMCESVNARYADYTNEYIIKEEVLEEPEHTVFPGVEGKVFPELREFAQAIAVCRYDLNYRWWRGDYKQSASKELLARLENEEDRDSMLKKLEELNVIFGMSERCITHYGLERTNAILDAAGIF